MNSLPVPLFRIGLVLLICAATATGGESTTETKPDVTKVAGIAAPPEFSATDLRFWEAIKLLEKPTAPEQEKGVAMLKKLAEDEIPKAQTYLGYLYFSGHHSLKKDPKRAVALFRLAAERGDGFAMVSLAQARLQGTGIRKDKEEAKKWLEKAVGQPGAFKSERPPPSYFADRDDSNQLSGSIEVDQVKKTLASAHFLLGQILRDEGKLSDAHLHFVAAAEAEGTLFGPAEASIEAALDFAFAKGTTRDMEKANQMIALSKKQTRRTVTQIVHDFASSKIVDEFAMGDLEDETDTFIDDVSASFQTGIANDFLDKKNKLYDPAAAEKWLLLGADAGNKGVQYDLAIHYAKGDFGKVDNQAAFKWFEKTRDQFPMAAVNYAIALQNGLGVARDPEKAGALFQKRRFENLIFYLGSIGKCPEQFLTIKEMVTLTQTLAKEKNDGRAEAFLGYILQNGYGLPYDFDGARKWYKRSAKNQDVLGLYRYASVELSALRREDYKAATPYLDMLKKSVAGGNPDAAVDFGYYANKGFYMPKDVELGKEYFLKAIVIDPENDLAMNNLGVIYKNAYERAVEKGDLPEADRQISKAIELWLQAKKLALANYNLGEIYRTGSEVPAAGSIKKDDAKAYSYYLTAAENGHVASRRILGEMHLKGIGVPRTPTEAAYHFRLAALDGDIDALERLILMYMNGQGVSKDFDRAFMWINMLQRKGRYSSLILATDALLNKKEYKLAMEYLEFLEESGNPSVVGFVNFRYFMIYSNGWGVKANPAKAKRCYEKALKNGSTHAILEEGRRLAKEKKFSESAAMLQKVQGVLPEASTLLGELYFKGNGVPKDTKTALKLFKEAAQEGDPYGLCWHAYMTAMNVPDAPSLTEAIEEAKQALKLGVEPAKNLLNTLESRQKNGAPTTPATSEPSNED